jgi:hypothetical protein
MPDKPPHPSIGEITISENPSQLAIIFATAE